MYFDDLGTLARLFSYQKIIDLNKEDQDKLQINGVKKQKKESLLAGLTVNADGKEFYQKALKELVEPEMDYRLHSALKDIMHWFSIKEQEIQEFMTPQKIDESLKEKKDQMEQFQSYKRLLQNLKFDKALSSYYEKRNELTKNLQDTKDSLTDVKKKIEENQEKMQKQKETMSKQMQKFLRENHIIDIYEKMDPHDRLNNLKPEFDFNKEGKPCLYFLASGDDDKDYAPQWYFSAAQLNIVAFSLFIGKALLSTNMPCNCLMIDDPIGHFDDMNVLNFADLLRTIIEKTDRQVIISTHDRRIYQLLQRKIPEEQYPVKYTDCRKLKRHM